jgi:hypothetical protein
MISEERKEAIEYLKKYKELDKQLYQTALFTSVSRDAIVKCLRHWDTAIQALEQDTCGDAINRDAVLEKAVYTETEEGWCGYTVDVDYIKSLPPVISQPKTGYLEWVPYDYNPKLGDWHCSECGCVVVECVEKNEKGGIPLYKYCPQCGAKMSEIPTGSEGRDKG